MIRVFYDGKYGRKIDHYKRIPPQNIFEWIDITVNSARLVELNVTIQAGLKLLHVQGKDEKMYQGVGSFLLIWENIMRFRFLQLVYC